jgi:hypothetical protein
MKKNLLSEIKQREIIKILLVLISIVFSLNLYSQTPTNFTGKWEFDKASSDKDERGDASFDGKIILEINQNSENITFTNTFYMPGKDGKTLRPDSYLINGEITKDDTGIDPAIKFVKWSEDKKILSTHYIMTATIDGTAQEFLTAKTYKLGDDGKTLLVEELKKSLLNGEKTIKKVYFKNSR